MKGKCLLKFSLGTEVLVDTIFAFPLCLEITACPASIYSCSLASLILAGGLAWTGTPSRPHYAKISIPLWPCPTKPSRWNYPSLFLPHCPTKESECTHSSQETLLECLALVAMGLVFLGPKELKQLKRQFLAGYHLQGTSQTVN